MFWLGSHRESFSLRAAADRALVVIPPAKQVRAVLAAAADGEAIGNLLAVSLVLARVRLVAPFECRAVVQFLC